MDRTANPNFSKQRKKTLSPSPRASQRAFHAVPAMTAAAEILFTGDIVADRRCDGDGCPARNPWPLHHVGHRAAFRRLCTACVLRHHRGFFCSACLEVLDSPPPPACDASAAGVTLCLRCPAAAHSSCLPDAAAPNYLCPLCEDPEGFSYFPVGDKAEQPRRHIDAAAAGALLAASRIAAASMSRAAAVARVEAERKVRQAVVARKRAREMLESVVFMPKMRKGDIVVRKLEEEGIKKNSSTGKKEFGALKVKKKKKKKKKKATSSFQNCV